MLFKKVSALLANELESVGGVKGDLRRNDEDIRSFFLFSCVVEIAGVSGDSKFEQGVGIPSVSYSASKTLSSGPPIFITDGNDI